MWGIDINQLYLKRLSVVVLVEPRSNRQYCWSAVWDSVQAVYMSSEFKRRATTKRVIKTPQRYPGAQKAHKHGVFGPSQIHNRRRKWVGVRCRLRLPRILSGSGVFSTVCWGPFRESCRCHSLTVVFALWRYIDPILRQPAATPVLTAPIGSTLTEFTAVCFRGSACWTSSSPRPQSLATSPPLMEQAIM